MSFEHLMWHTGRKTAALVPPRYIAVSAGVWILSFLGLIIVKDMGLGPTAAAALAASLTGGVIFACFRLVTTWCKERDDGRQIKPPLITALTITTAGVLSLMVALHYLAVASVSADGTLAQPRRFWAALASLGLGWLLARLRIRQIRRGY
jgi:hypothetical protein